MTLLDDYETLYRLRGVQVVSEMIERVPADLLRRTGVDGLLFSVGSSQRSASMALTPSSQSLKKCLAFLQNPETPALICAAIPALVSLVLLTTAPGSAQRFDQLCDILGNGIIGSVWFYAVHEQAAIEASIDVLPRLVHALGVGTARYLKVSLRSVGLPSTSNFGPRRSSHSSYSLSCRRLETRRAYGCR